jgi:hypothetical protein
MDREQSSMALAATGVERACRFMVCKRTVLVPVAYCTLSPKCTESGVFPHQDACTALLFFAFHADTRSAREKADGLLCVRDVLAAMVLATASSSSSSSTES